MNKFRIWLATKDTVSAYRTEFFNENGSVLRSTRGKLPGALINYGTFQWSSAVKAMVVLMVSAKRTFLASNNCDFCMLEGYAGSLACSFDFCISKEPTWLCEMFGCDQSGRPLARKIFARSNSNRKHPGPVLIGLNPRQLTPDNISMFVDDEEIVSSDAADQLLQMIDPLSAACVITESLNMVA